MMQNLETSPSDSAPVQPLNVSVAIPIYNEELVLPELYRRLRDVLAELPGDHEIVFVDDGSDQAAVMEVLTAIALADTRVKVVSLSRNFGHQTALTAALENVSGEVVVLMDGDLQDTPETIPRFVAKHREGFDVVYAIRQDRKESLLKRTCYAAFYRIISRLSRIDLPENAGDFSLISRRVVDEICRSPEQHRYLRGLRTWVGFKQTGIPVERAARHAGEPKYNLRKLMQLAFDGIFSFSVAPLRAATMFGVATIFLSLTFAGYSVFAHLFLAQSPAGFTALIVAITFLAGVQLLFLGIIGEYIGRIYEEVKRRPHFIVDKIVTAETLGAGMAGGQSLESGSTSDNLPIKSESRKKPTGIVPLGSDNPLISGDTFVS